MFVEEKTNVKNNWWYFCK